jgi:Cdc6-like AAA superfamily ATPase
MDSGPFDRLMESSPLRQWINRTIQSFWLYGSPGTGKTVLCTQLIEHVQVLCDMEGKFCLYFYFHFRNSQSIVDILGSIIAQLCQQTSSLPQPLRDMYNICRQGKLAPLKEHLLQALDFLLIATSKGIYIILEGLDECSERDEVFQLIGRLLQAGAALFISSRPEADIANALQDLMDCSVDLTSPPEEIIRQHIRKVIEFESWPSELKIEVEEALVEQSQGKYSFL